MSPQWAQGTPHLTHVAVHAAHCTALFDPQLNSLVPHKTHVSPHMTYMTPISDHMTPHRPSTMLTGPPKGPWTTNKAHVSPLLDLHEPSLRPHDTPQGPQDPPQGPWNPHKANKPPLRSMGPTQGPGDPLHKVFELQLQLSYCMTTFCYDSWAPLISLTLMITAIRMIRIKCFNKNRFYESTEKTILWKKKSRLIG